MGRAWGPSKVEKSEAHADTRGSTQFAWAFTSRLEGRGTISKPTLPTHFGQSALSTNVVMQLSTLLSPSEEALQLLAAAALLAAVLLALAVMMLPGAAPPRAPASAAAASYQLTNKTLPATTAAQLLQDIATAGAPGLLGRVSPPARLLGANPSNNRLSWGDVCELFLRDDYRPGEGRHAAAYAFKDFMTQQAEPLPADARDRWTGSFGGRWTEGFLQQHGFIKNHTTFKSKDGRYKVGKAGKAGRAGRCFALSTLAAEETDRRALRGTAGDGLPLLPGCSGLHRQARR